MIFINSIIAKDICKGSTPDTCKKSMNYIENLVDNKNGLKKIEAVAYLGAYSSVNKFFTEYGIKTITRELNKLQIYKSALFDEKFYAMDFQKVGDTIYVVEAYFKDNNRHFTGFNTYKMPSTVSVKEDFLIINNEKFVIDKNSLPFYKSIVKKSKQDRLKQALNIKSTKIVKKDDIASLITKKTKIEKEQLCLKQNKKVTIRNKNKTKLIYVDNTNEIYILPNQTFASTYLGADNIQHKFYVYQVIELDGKNVKDLNYYITAGSSYYRKCQENQKELKDEDPYQVY